MKGEKIRTHSKEFAAQVSDYIPSPRRKNPTTEAQPASDLKTGGPSVNAKEDRPDRPWNLFDSQTRSLPPEGQDKTEHKSATNQQQTGNTPPYLSICRT